MYELEQLSSNCYYIESPAKIGIVKVGERDVCLIDSGSDKDAGRKIRKILDANQWQLTAIYNTHSHADHIGGNQYLQSQTGCAIYAPEADCSFTNHTILEPSFLYGAYPPKELTHKFLMAKPSLCSYLTPACLPHGLEMLDLKGHCFNMVGFRSKDDVVYLADCLFSDETLEKYKISYIYDVESYINTLEYVKTMEAKHFVPSHGSVTEDIVPLAQRNLNQVYEIADKILAICASPICFEHILQALFSQYQLNLTLDQYVLVGSTVKSYLAWLKNHDRLHFYCENNLLLWQAN